MALIANTIKYVWSCSTGIDLTFYDDSRPYYFFFECSKYSDIRSDLLTFVNRFGIKFDLALLTIGNQNLTVYLFREFCKFIRRSNMIMVSTKQVFLCSLSHM